jgi:SNF2 family DNA or RNA helicase
MLLSGEGLGTETLRYLHELRSGLSTGKIPTTVQLVHSAVEQGANVVVFCHYRDSVEAIHAALADGALAAVGVHGGYTQDVRDARVEWFRSGFGNVLVATYDSLGVGVNLQCASVVVHHDLDWVPATHLQAAARVWRQGQTRPVISYLVYAENTVDEVIARVLASKIEDIAVVEGSAENYRGLGSLVIRHEVEEWFDRVLERVMA